jgi:hypothetical protein
MKEIIHERRKIEMIFRASYEENAKCEGEKLVLQGEIESYENLSDFVINSDNLLDYIITLLEEHKVISLNDVFEYYRCDEDIPMICGVAENQEEFLKNNFAVLVEG